MQKKSLPSGKELVSGSPLTPCKKSNQPDKAKHCPLQKTLVLRNQNGKNSLPLETRMQPGKNLDGQIKVSFSSEINNKIENKENVLSLALAAKSETNYLTQKSLSFLLRWPMPFLILTVL